MGTRVASNEVSQEDPWSSLRNSFKDYLELSKSGIVMLVLVSVTGGYLAGFPQETPFDFLKLFLSMMGIGLLASGGAALNQVQEKKMDEKMERTRSRPLPAGRISPTRALWFSGLSILGGLSILFFWVSPSVAALGGVAAICYNFLYTLWWKPRWAFAAVPGAIPGALPILMGYAASSGQVFQVGGLYLFFLMLFWQMPHFWVLALKYESDYKKGGVPTLPVVFGPRITEFHIELWCLAYAGLALIAPMFLEVGPIYLISALFISALLLFELRRFRRTQNQKGWFRFFMAVNLSLIALLASVAIDIWSFKLLFPYLV